MKKLLLTLISASSYVCFSQTINAPTIPAAGVVFTVKGMATAVSNASVNGVWDFSTQVTAPESNFYLLPASSSPSANDFPTATHVRMIGTNVEAFIQYDGNNYKFCGMPYMLYPNTLQMHTWPLSVGYAHTDSVSMTFPGPGGVTITREDKIVVNGLSTGTLIMPDGTTYNNALLVKNYRTFDDVPPNSTTTFTTTLDMYHWWVDGYPVPLAETRLQTNPNDPTVYASSTFRKPVSSLNIGENQKLNVAIYPNPTNSELVFETQQISFTKQDNIKIFSILGEQLYSSSLSSQKTRIDLSNYSTGTYILVTRIDGIQKTFKILKE